MVLRCDPALIHHPDAMPAHVEPVRDCKRYEPQLGPEVAATIPPFRSAFGRVGSLRNCLKLKQPLFR